MAESFPNLKLLGISRGNSSPAGTVTNRRHCLLMLKTSGVTYYHIDQDTVWPVRAGDILFIPIGWNYSVKTTIPGQYIAVIFDADCTGALPCKMRLPYSEELFARFFATTDISSADAFRQLSIFYDILHRLSTSRQNIYLSSDRNAVIDDAIQYIDLRFSDPKFRISALHFRYGISNVYFCKIFKQRKGITPSEHLALVRLKKAKELLAAGNKISFVAAAVGFSDPLYFSKFFSKHTGMTPTAYCEYFAE